MIATPRHTFGFLASAFRLWGGRAWRCMQINFFPVLGLLLFLGAMFWAKAQDPFTRHWFTLKTPEYHSFQCVTVLPKPVRRCPVVIYAHGSGGSLMTDGNELRQMAELGLATVSLEYDQDSETNFDAEFATVLQYVARQPWADTNAMAWVGFSLGANRRVHLAMNGRIDRLEARPTLTPQLLVLISGEGLGGKVDGRMKIEETGKGRPRPTAPGAGGLPRTVPVLLIHGEQDEIFPVADTQRLAEEWQTNGQPVTWRILPGLAHALDPERGVIFRAIGEYCLAHLGGPVAWEQYHSFAQWQAEAPALGWFWLPALAWMGLRFTRVGQASGGNEEGRMKNEEPAKQESEGGSQESECAEMGDCLTSGSAEGGAGEAARSEPEAKTSSDSFWRKLGRRGSTALPIIGRLASGALPWLAAVLATCAITETALHLVPPHLVINEGGTPGQGTQPTVPMGEGAGPTGSFFNTLELARRFLVQPKERADFEWLAAQPIWNGVKLETLLDHVELAVYNRELINWTLEEAHYRDYVLNPIITNSAPALLRSTAAGSGDPAYKTGGFHLVGPVPTPGVPGFGLSLAWRRPLWEEFYPRIRHENSVADAVPIVVRHLRERVTIAELPGLPHSVPEIWRRQITDANGFAIIYVAALRSVGVPARLAGVDGVEGMESGYGDRLSPPRGRAEGVEFWDGTRWQAAPDPAVTVW